MSLLEKLTHRTAGTLPVQSRYSRGAVEVGLRCGRGMLAAQSRHAQGAVEAQSRCG